MHSIKGLFLYYKAITLYLKILSFLQFYVGVHLREQFFAQVKSIFSTLEQKNTFFPL
jgi:hypothetical protein